MKIPPDSNVVRSGVYVKLGKIAACLGSPARLRILQLLAQSPKTVEDLSESSGFGFANISQHLQKLSAEGFVTCAKDGLKRVYRVSHPEIVGILESLQDLAHEIAPELNSAEAVLTDASLCSPMGAKEVLRLVRLKQAILLDVRDEREACATPVEGAASMPLSRLKRECRQLERGQTVYVFCRGRYCSLASQAVRLLRREGFEAFRLQESSYRLNQVWRSA